MFWMDTSLFLIAHYAPMLAATVCSKLCKYVCACMYMCHYSPPSSLSPLLPSSLPSSSRPPLSSLPSSSLPPPSFLSFLSSSGNYKAVCRNPSLHTIIWWSQGNQDHMSRSRNSDLWPGHFFCGSKHRSASTAIAAPFSMCFVSLPRWQTQLFRMTLATTGEH